MWWWVLGSGSVFGDFIISNTTLIKYMPPKVKIVIVTKLRMDVKFVFRHL